jgi:hypothetical protein
VEEIDLERKRDADAAAAEKKRLSELLARAEEAAAAAEERLQESRWVGVAATL